MESVFDIILKNSIIISKLFRIKVSETSKLNTKKDLISAAYAIKLYLITV